MSLLLLFHGAFTGVTGTAGIAETDDAVASAGAIVLKGSAGLTEASDALSATAAVALKGAAALVEAGDTLGAAGVLRIGGAAGIAETSDSIASIGALPILGAAGVVAADVAVLAAGSAGGNAGTVAATEASDTLAAAARLALAGAVTVTLADAALSAAGQVAQLPLVVPRRGGAAEREAVERRDRDWERDLKRIIDEAWAMAHGLADPVTHKPLPKSDIGGLADALALAQEALDREQLDALLAETASLQEEEAVAMLLLAA